MLLILDQEKNYKLFRTSEDDNGMKRERIGILPKSSLDISDELKSAMSGEELVELQDAVTALKEGRDLKARARAHEFPATTREVVEYVTSAGTPLEQRLVTTAVLEALRLLRRAERQKSGSDMEHTA